MKNKGWKGESQRHSMASKGVTTKYGVKTLIGRDRTDAHRFYNYKDTKWDFVEGIDGRTYKVTDDGTWYDKKTLGQVIDILQWAKDNDVRIRIYYGDTETGEDWSEEYDVNGYVGRSNGSIKIPLLIHNKKSYGGGGILTGSIVGIEFANRKEGGVIYKNQNYHVKNDKME